MAQQQLRDAQAPLPVTHVVSPDGMLKDIPYGAGINGGIVEFKPGRGPRISQEARDRGWRLLGEMYADENRAADHAEFLRFRGLAAAGQVNPASFPDDMLPKELLERRARNKKRPAELPTFERKATTPTPKGK